MSSITVLGIDPGTAITGYGIVRSDGRVLTPLDYGCVRTAGCVRLSQKYKIIYNALTDLIAEYHPEAISVETQYVNKNVQSALKLGMARGMVLLAAAQAGIPVFEYTPSRAKLAVVGSGRASKEQVQAMTKTLLCLSEIPRPEDAADALALAICHIHMASRSLLALTEI